MPSFGVKLLQGTIDTIENHYTPKMQQEAVSYVNESTGAIQAKLNHYDTDVARFDSGLDDCRDKVGQVLHMSSTLVHLEQFERVVRQINSVESRLREPFVTVKSSQQWRECTALNFGGMQLQLSELQQEVCTLIALPQFGGDTPHDEPRVAHYESQVSIFLQRLDAMSHELHSCQTRLDACEKKYTYLETQMGQFEGSYSPLARVIPGLQSVISNSIKVQGELDARVQKMESVGPSHHTGNIDGLISKVDKMHSRCKDLDNGVNGIHGAIEGLKTSHNASMVAVKTNIATSLRDNTANVTRAYENTIGDLGLQTETKYEVFSSQFATWEVRDNARRVDAIENKLEDVEKTISLHVGFLHEASSSASPPNPPPNLPPHSFDVPMFATKIKTLEVWVHQLELAGPIEKGPVPVDLSSAVRELQHKSSGIIEQFQVRALEREETFEFRQRDAFDACESKLLTKIEELQAQISLRGVGNSTTQGNNDGDHRNNNGAPSQEQTQVPISCAPSAHEPFVHTLYATNSHNHEASDTSSSPQPFPPPAAQSPPPPSPPTPQQPPSQTAWLLDEEGKIIPSRALMNTEKRDIVPSGVPDGDLAFFFLEFTPQTVPDRQQYQVDGSHGVFRS